MTHETTINGQLATIEEAVEHIMDNTSPFSPAYGFAWAGGQGGCYPLWDDPRPVCWAEVRAILAEMVTDLGAEADWADWSVSVVEVD